MSSWQETNLDTGHTVDHGDSDRGHSDRSHADRGHSDRGYSDHGHSDHGQSDYDYDVGPLVPPGHYEPSNVETPLYVDTRGPGADVTSPLNSEDMQHTGFSE